MRSIEPALIKRARVARCENIGGQHRRVGPTSHLLFELVCLPFELVEPRDGRRGETGPYRLSHSTSHDELLRGGEATLVGQCAGVVAVTRSDDEEQGVKAVPDAGCFSN
jgi:hypothetical protein